MSGHLAGWWWTAPVVAYLLGSLSFAWMAGKYKGIDLRQHGSGNLGATNAGRVLGGRWFIAVFLCDVLKGLLPVLVVMHRAPVTVPGAVYLPLAVAVGAILGHIFTCFHGFRGGKAVATSLGVLIGLFPLVALIALVVWLLVWGVGCAARLGRSNAVGPASVVAAMVAPVAEVLLSQDPWGQDLPRSIFIIALAVLVVIKHRSNLRKLFAKSAAPSTAPSTQPPAQR